MNITINPGEVTEIPLSDLLPDPNQPRKHFEEVPLQELADDINLRGVQDPIKVRFDNENKLIIAEGERRFRASQLALKTSIPCLLKEDDKKDKAPEVSRLLSQVKENHLRQALNPMEWAMFLKKLRDDHQIKVAGMEVFLTENAIHNMSRSYISNLIRLNDLPEWAQQLITEGKLTAAHGKYLLAAKPSPAVMDEMKNVLLEDEYYKDLSTRELEDEILAAYRQLELNLGISKFNVEQECKGCKKKKNLTASWGAEIAFCLDKKCHGEKQAKAAEKATSERKSDNEPLHTGSGKTRQPATEVKANKKGIVELDKRDDIDGEDDMRLLEDADFNLKTCEGCKYNKQAQGEELNYLLGEDEGAKVIKHVCFDVHCFEEKTEKEFADHERQLPFIKYIATRLREHIAARHLPNNEELQLNLLGYMAMGWPVELVGRSEGHIGCDVEYHLNESLPDILNMKNLKSILENDAMKGITIIARNAIMNMGLQSLGMLAAHLKVNLNDFFKMDNRLLELFSKEELITWGELTNKDIGVGAVWTKATKGEADDLYPFFKQSDLEGDNMPKDIQNVWGKLINLELS